MGNPEIAWNILLGLMFYFGLFLIIGIFVFGIITYFVSRYKK